MRSRVQRFAGFWLTVSIAAAITAFISYTLTSRIFLREANHILLADSARAIQLGDAHVSEAKETLSVINSLADVPCSEEDIAALNKLVFLSRFLKDAGRMQGGRFLCSSVFPKSVLPKADVSPSSIGYDGLRTYRWMPQWQIYTRQTMLFQIGTAYVDVFLDSHGELSQRSLPGEEYFVSLRPEKLQFLAPEIRATSTPRGKFYVTPGEHVQGNLLLGTSCSTVLAHCVTESIRTQEVLRLNSFHLMAYTGLGGVIGALLGWVIFLRLGRDNTIAGRLRRAIRRGEIGVVFQPITDLADFHVCGAEVLARWVDDDGLPVGPDVFTRIAEEHGLMDMLTKRVVQRALREARTFLNNRPEFRLSFNVTDTDLRGSTFAPMLSKLLSAACISPEQVAIEVTEHAPLSTESVATLHVLHKRGHEVHIDDFGTGYSSLPYLTELPVSAIKIDKSYTHAVNTTDLKAGILPQIILMAESLNLGIIVEGIETPEQAEYFIQQGKVVLAQGWLFGKPLPWQGFERQLKNSEAEIETRILSV